MSYQVTRSGIKQPQIWFSDTFDARQGVFKAHLSFRTEWIRDSSERRHSYSENQGGEPVKLRAPNIQCTMSHKSEQDSKLRFDAAFQLKNFSQEIFIARNVQNLFHTLQLSCVYAQALRPSQVGARETSLVRISLIFRQALAFSSPRVSTHSLLHLLTPIREWSGKQGLTSKRIRPAPSWALLLWKRKQ